MCLCPTLQCDNHHNSQSACLQDLQGVCCRVCRKNFDKWWKMTWTTVKIPGKGTIYDYFVNFKTSKFMPWTDLVSPRQQSCSTSLIPWKQSFGCGQGWP